MSKVFVEVWKSKPAWSELSPEERGAYMERIGPDIQSVVEAGVEVLAAGVADEDVDHRGDFEFFAIWRAPDEETSREFERRIADSGWYEYFDQANVRGDDIGLEQLIGRMVALQLAA